MNQALSQIPLVNFQDSRKIIKRARKRHRVIILSNFQYSCFIIDSDDHEYDDEVFEDPVEEDLVEEEDFLAKSRDPNVLIILLARF